MVCAISALIAVLGCASPTDPEGLYFGISRSSNEKTVWIFRLKEKKGYFYRPPNFLAIRRFEEESEGRLKFETEPGLGEIVYRFDGIPTVDGLAGAFIIDPSETKVRVDLSRVESDAQDSRTGFYSNVEYVEESGDLVGVEFTLLLLKGKLVGIFTDYENGMRPTAVEVKENLKDLSFEVRDQDAIQRFTLEFQNNLEIRLIVKDNPEPIVLKKKQELERFLSGPNKTRS